MSNVLADAFIEGRLVLEVGPNPSAGAGAGGGAGGGGGAGAVDPAAAAKYKGAKMAMYMQMQGMCREMRDAGTRMFTMLNSQLPYTYVVLVAFMCAQRCGGMACVGLLLRLRLF